MGWRAIGLKFLLRLSICSLAAWASIASLGAMDSHSPILALWFGVGGAIGALLIFDVESDRAPILAAVALISLVATYSVATWNWDPYSLVIAAVFAPACGFAVRQIRGSRRRAR